MKFLLLVIALVVGSAATSEAQVYKPRGKGPALVKKAEVATAATAKADPKAAPAVAAKATPVASRKVTTQPAKSRVARDSRPDDLTPDPPEEEEGEEGQEARGRR